MKKRTCGILLTLAMILSLMLPISAASAPESNGSLTYTVIISPQYEDALEFSEGLAAVKKDGLWGFIDLKGNTVIPFQYECASSFSEGYACVAKPGTPVNSMGSNYDNCPMGFVDTKGNYTPFLCKDGTNYIYPTFAFVDPEIQVYNFHNGYLSTSATYDFTIFNTSGHAVIERATCNPNGGMNEGLIGVSSVSTSTELLVDGTGENGERVPKQLRLRLRHDYKGIPGDPLHPKRVELLAP